ncbi:MAG: ribonuclease E/G, partial [Armatimonadetes bacterium]|nr:ribonuclease E/G [Armatimonadota bacterium]
MTKEIIVNVGERETRIAVLEDGKLFELHIEREERVVGSLFKARVDNVLPGMDAAFVDIGLERRAFLYVGDVLPSIAADLNGGKVGSPQAAQPTENGHPVVATEDTEETEEPTDENELEAAETGNGQPNPRQFAFRRSILRRQQIKDVLKVGQEIVVQVIKGPRGTKGARVSTRISLPGRYLVLMPEADNVGVSRKIDDPKERERLKKIGGKLREPGFGIILRTEAEDKTEQELRLDRDFLLKLWQQICEKSRASQAPAVVHRDLTLVYKAIRDIFGSDVNRLVIDDPAEYESACKLLDMVSPELKPRVHLYSGGVPIFDHFNLEAEIELF